jgi:hypothetical protein
MRHFKTLVIFALLLLFGQVPLAWSQISFTRNAAGPAWPADSASSRLQTALDDFLRTRADTAARAARVWPPAALETTALLDELTGLEQAAGQPASPYQLYLSNLVQLDSTNYLLQLAALGLHEQTPRLRASFELRAKLVEGKFLFYSPLLPNTAAWQQRLIGLIHFHYLTASDFNRKAATAYARKAAFFDKKTGSPPIMTDFYVCGNLPAALRAVGLDSKADYQGEAHDNLSARLPGRLLVLSGDAVADRFDPHDLWHARLRNVLAADSTNKAVDEGCAMLYGGSWGISWPVILSQFRAYARARPGADWLALYPTSASVSTGGQRPLRLSYVINALIVEELERTKGFGAVKELLSCGRYEPTNARYFQTLERVAGISRASFNTRVEVLLQAARF